MNLDPNWKTIDGQDRTHDICPQCGRKKMRKNPTCRHCKVINGYSYHKGQRTQDKKGYCQNKDCPQRLIELNRSDMIFNGKLWLCERCNGNIGE